MTDLDWDAQRDPLVLLDHLFPLRGLDSAEQQPRESRLFLIGCARLAWDRLPCVAQRLVELAEDRVDGHGPGYDLRYPARELAEELANCRGEPEDLDELERKLRALDSRFERRISQHPKFEAEEWGSLAHLVYFPFAGTTPNYRRIAKEHLSLELLRDVFPNPFRPVNFLPEWLDRNVTGIARGMYASRDFSPMPLLADALQDAGCSNEHVVNHCRSPGPHIRGCWVIEGLLRKMQRAGSVSDG